MPARWIGNPYSYNAFKAAVGAQVVAVGAPAVPAATRHIVVEEQATYINGRKMLAVRLLLRRPDGSTAAFTGGFMVEDIDRALSAGLVASWCNTLGINPNTLGVDDTW